MPQVTASDRAILTVCATGVAVGLTLILLGLLLDPVRALHNT